MMKEFTDEEIEKFAFDSFDGGAAGGFRQRGMGDAERTCIATQTGEPFEQRGIGRTHQQRGQQRVFLRASRIDFIYIAGHLCFAEEIGPQHHQVDASQALDRHDPFGWNTGPIGNRWLRDADLTGKRGDQAGSAAATFRDRQSTARR